MLDLHDDLDRRARAFVYDVSLRRGRPPSIEETAAGVGEAVEEVRSAFQRLAAGRVLVLQGGSSEILMAPPFSAAPTPFEVVDDSGACFANCAWDALGVPAMRRRDARVLTSCGDCGALMRLRVEGGALKAGEGVVHFAVPARSWWDDIVFT
jgi:hypothetical protein